MLIKNSCLGGIILFLFFCSPVFAFAEGASNAWNSSWNFSGVAEKNLALNRALSMELIEGEGLSSTYNVNSESYKYCEAEGTCNEFTSTAIGTLVEITGNNNSDIAGTNSGAIDSQTVTGTVNENEAN